MIRCILGGILSYDKLSFGEYSNLKHAGINIVYLNSEFFFTVESHSSCPRESTPANHIKHQGTKFQNSKRIKNKYILKSL